jgi:VWFA-related protein
MGQSRPRRNLIATLLATFVCVAVPLAQRNPTPVPPRPQPAPAPSQETPTFRVSIRYVEVDAVVEDQKGKFVSGLTKDDFVLLEDGRPQTIDKATLVDLPETRPGEHDEPFANGPDGRAPNDSALTSFEQSGRIYVLLMDSGPSDSVTRLARRFIESYLAPGDLTAVVHVSRAKGQPLTGNKELLIAATERYRPRFGTDEASFKTLRDVAVSLGSVTGRRRSIVMIGTGLDLWAEDQHIHEKWDLVYEATRTANAFNVPIHTLDPTSMAVANVGGHLVTGSEREQGLRLLSDYTGGITMGNKNGAEKGFKRVVAANSRYYILGYYSNVEHDEKNHPIVVRVSRPDVTVTGRTNVRGNRPLPKAKTVNLPGSLAPTIRGALKGRDAPSGIPIDVTSTMYRGDNYMGSVVVSGFVTGADLQLGAGQKVRFSAAATDVSGVIRAEDDRTFSFDLRESARSRIQQYGVQFFTRLVLPPGSYTVQVAVDQPAGAAGVASIPVVVPDFADGTLFFSDLAVGQRQRAALTLLSDRTLRRELPGGPTRRRRFSANEDLSVYAEVYDTHWPLAPRLDLKWTIATNDGTALTSGTQGIETVFGGRAEFRGRIPLRNVPPGAYVLKVEAFSTLGPPASVVAELPFEVAAAEQR